MQPSDEDPAAVLHLQPPGRSSLRSPIAPMSPICYSSDDSTPIHVLNVRSSISSRLLLMLDYAGGRNRERRGGRAPGGARLLIEHAGRGVNGDAAGSCESTTSGEQLDLRRSDLTSVEQLNLPGLQIDLRRAARTPVATGTGGNQNRTTPA